MTSKLARILGAFALMAFFLSSAMPYVEAAFVGGCDIHHCEDAKQGSTDSDDGCTTACHHAPAPAVAPVVNSLSHVANFVATLAAPKFSAREGFRAILVEPPRLS